MLAANHAVTGQTMANVTGFSHTLAANTDYAWLVVARTTTSGTGVGLHYRFTGPATPDMVWYGGNHVSSGAAWVGDAEATAFSATISPPNWVAGTIPIYIVGAVENGANAGTLQMQTAAETAGGTATMVRGSFMLVWEL
jgi:hypothetical protein